MRKYIYFVVLACLSAIVLILDFRLWPGVIVLNAFAIFGYMRTRHLVENSEKIAKQFKEENKKQEKRQ